MRPQYLIETPLELQSAEESISVNPYLSQGLNEHMIQMLGNRSPTSNLGNSLFVLND